MSAQRLHVHVDKELGSRGAGYAPYYVGGVAVVPLRHLVDDSGCVGWFRDVGGYEMEALRAWVLCGCLRAGEKLLDIVFDEAGWRVREERTLTVLRAASSLATLRETRMTLAPLADS